MTKRTAAKSMKDAEALKLVMDMMVISGRPGEEANIMDFIRGKLLDAGLPASALTADDAPRRSPLGGQVGNLVVKLPGTVRGLRRMLSAHVDTVPICVGSRPVRGGKLVVNANKKAGLGGRHDLAAFFLEDLLVVSPGQRADASRGPRDP